jgi:tetratricopeptide (TPR) repeat protein
MADLLEPILGVRPQEQSQYDKMEELIKLSLPDVLLHIGDPKLSLVLLMVSGLYLYTIGRRTEAKEILEEILLRERNSEWDVEMTITAANGFGMVLRDNGDFEPAIRLFDILIQDSTEKKDLQSLLAFKMNRALVFFNMGLANTALDQYKDLLNIHILNYGQSHMDVLHIQTQIASVLTALGREPEAVELLNKIQSTLTGEAKESHPLFARVKEHVKIISQYQDQNRERHGIEETLNLYKSTPI